MHQGTTFRCTHVANGDFFFMNMNYFGPKSDAQRSQIVILDLTMKHPLLKGSQNSVDLDRQVNKHLTKYLT